MNKTNFKGLRAPEKKKAWRREILRQVKEGLINQPDGRMVPERNLSDNSMKRDFYTKQRAS